MSAIAIGLRSEPDFNGIWRRKTVIVVTHDPDTAAHAKKIIRIEDGKIITE